MVYFLCKAYDSDRQNCYFALSLPVRGAWIEILRHWFRRPYYYTSLPVRGAWIEMMLSIRPYAKRAVAPRAGSVD